MSKKQKTNPWVQSPTGGSPPASSPDNLKISQAIDDLRREFKHFGAQADVNIKKVESSLEWLKQQHSKPKPKMLRRLWLRLSRQGLIVGATKSLGFLIAVIGLLSSVYSLLPKISISLKDADQGDLLNSQVEIANDGVLPIYEVHVACGVGQILGKDLISRAGDWKRSEWAYNPAIVNSDQAKIVVIRAGQKATTSDFCPFQGLTGFADVALWVYYRDFLHVYWKQAFRLITVRDSKGNVSWMQQPL